VTSYDISTSKLSNTLPWSSTIADLVATTSLGGDGILIYDDAFWISVQQASNKTLGGQIYKCSPVSDPICSHVSDVRAADLQIQTSSVTDTAHGFSVALIAPGFEAQTFLVPLKSTEDRLRANYQWYEILGSILYVEWGIIHIMAMVMILVSSSKNNLSETYKGLYDQYIADSNNAKEYENMAGKWPKHAGRVHMQHAINLGVAGVLACLAPALIASAAWSRFLWIFALVPWLFDVAYWICLDVPELVGIPGQLQTYIVSGGLFCFAFSVNIRFNGQGQYAPGDFEKWAMYIVPCILFALGLIQKIFGLAGCNVFRFLICGENSNTEDLSPRHQEPKEPEDGQAQTAMPSMGGGGGKGDNALTV